eukprot:TRINITY_DN942_c0_g1_i11.p1 TRINITY_DN942_c0_g1~~TRINITY_DN942_c0_g1_i11.p1  ORF type:complete len:145 (+),score=29.39 TRINITY_DN942_c0_g1_i11:165-599(+)
MVSVKIDADEAEEQGFRPTKTVDFLMAGYAKYNVPYVWLRSEPSEALLNSGLLEEDDRDNPLVLATTTTWQYSSVKAADVLVELVSITLDEVPDNPFQIDFSFFEELSLFERTVCQASLLNFLRRVFVSEGNLYKYGKFGYHSS